MPRALICGSMAYDTIMVFEDQFKNHILPDKVHMLNVSFLVPQMRREFGGCAGNIAYNLRMLGGEPLPMATVGQDFAPYREWFQSHGIALDHLREVPDTFTAQGFVITDQDNNQIWGFHPGAMSFSQQNHVADAHDVALGIVAPDGRDGMLEHAREFAARGIPCIFDPGQAMPLFNGEEFRAFIEAADYVAANSYEASLLTERTGWSEADIAARVKAYIVTHGGEGSVIHADGKDYQIPAAKPKAVVDPTGCGDAYRAGLIHGILGGCDWPTTGRIASLTGALKIAKPGTQNHAFTLAEFRDEFKAQFGHALD
ncbi:MAG TPA: carbohydrate kinase family protein [Rhodanobacteraceae bacterium]|nr:carbohydrate kinase family protein [Rhodanobacteraceae bacterium]